MKKITVFILASLMFFGVLCGEGDGGSNPIVGSDQDAEILGLNFKIVNKSVVSNSLHADGIVTNASSSKVRTPWYVEGQFYLDSTKTLKLGGSNVEITVPLDPAQSTTWSLNFTPSSLQYNYTHFVVGDLRGIYKGQ